MAESEGGNLILKSLFGGKPAQFKEKRSGVVTSVFIFLKTRKIPLSQATRSKAKLERVKMARVCTEILSSAPWPTLLRGFAFDLGSLETDYTPDSRKAVMCVIRLCSQQYAQFKLDWKKNLFFEKVH